MSTIVTRAGKGSPLTNTEVDSNFTNLNTDKIEAGTTVTLTNKTLLLRMVLVQVFHCMYMRMAQALTLVCTSNQRVLVL